MSIVSLLYGYFKKYGEDVNPTLIKSVVSQVKEEYPDSCDSDIFILTVEKLRREYNCSNFNEEEVLKNMLEPFKEMLRRRGSAKET
jgi:hypothetical protein